MGPFRSISDARLSPVAKREDNLYFELHKLASEQKRLQKMRSILMERIRLLDMRLGEIAQQMKAITPKG